ncbi:MAG: uracil-DNA glycosylase [Candidatus Endonucleobacter sp. (ex Gigantidas childressi)]|nr:uracil-DNA glycosylase [Candidatus Endonucleobacter sp. (ex Gigantidas childressi)]
MLDISIDASWDTYIKNEFSKKYMQHLSMFLIKERKLGKVIHPQISEYFRALDLAPFEQVKVVILGQDPYHGPGQAHGLCFSVKPNVTIPPSLRNIYKELKDDLGIPPANHGFLEHWAKQGVLLLNSVLTVEHKQAGSHQKKGWEQFTDKIVTELNNHKEKLVFILWGGYAQKKGEFIDATAHLVLKSAHPSPLSARRGFFGSKPFSQTNDYLRRNGVETIDW